MWQYHHLLCFHLTGTWLSYSQASWDLYTQPLLGSQSLKDSEGSSSEAFAGGCSASFPAAKSESQGGGEQCLNEAELC